MRLAVPAAFHPGAKLLDGRRATTHFASAVPQIRVEGGALYSGPAWRAAALTLALVEEDYGFSPRARYRPDFVMYLRRLGGQLQFIVSDRHPGPD